MEAINPVRVMLFWDSEIARDAYGPYFTRTIRKSWTLPMNRMISHDELMVSDEPSMLYSTVNNDDDEVDGSDGDDVVSSQSESDDDNDSEEGEFQTPLNSVNPVNPIEQNKHRNLSSKFISMSISHLVTNDPEIPVSNIIQEVQCVEKMGQEQILMCRRYIRDKRTKELTKRIFIRS
ncbi:hypothetical protein M9H77_29604 [Catharanthus roseus]|uniref:Uncharacterized protein n=1 Tax=Catharanthus roseus TaxID=4058 RepID=A0ACB9ZW72_CATRO|nr:hypothetical protein M9H77_29604 [Catharanthus roseus]